MKKDLLLKYSNKDGSILPYKTFYSSLQYDFFYLMRKYKELKDDYLTLHGVIKNAFNGKLFVILVYQIDYRYSENYTKYRDKKPFLIAYLPYNYEVESVEKVVKLAWRYFYINEETV